MDDGVLTASIDQVGETAVVIKMQGGLLSSDDEILVDAFKQAKDGIRYVIVDFSAVSRLNSLGASLLVKLCTAAKRSGQSLLAVGLDDTYRSVFQLTNLDQAMRVCGSLSEVLALIKGSDAGREIAGGGSTASIAGDVLERRKAEAAFWAKPVPVLRVPEMPREAVSLNVAGRAAVGPVLGFGPLWEKTYEIRFDAAKVTPAAGIKALRERFPSFQPPENRFYASAAGIKVGEIVLINASSVGMPVYTGVVISYADDESFTLMTPQGHPESGWVSFRAFSNGGHTVCRIQGLARANDPIYEIAFRFHGAAVQERIWKHVLKSLGDYLGQNSPVDMKKVCVDSHLRWSQVGNARHNAQLWSLLYLAAWPFRRLARRSKR